MAQSDVFGTVSASLSVFDYILRLTGRLKTAGSQVGELPELLEQYQDAILQAKRWMDLVATDNSLQVPDLEASILKMKKLAERLKKILEKLSGGRNCLQQFWQQFTTGNADRMLIDKIMHDMGHVKLDLIVRVQLAQVGITDGVRDAVQLSVAAIEAMDAKLAPLGGSYPKLNLLFESHNVVNGCIDVSREDVDEFLSRHGLGFPSNSTPRASTPRRAHKDVSQNEVSESSIVVTGPLCTKELDPWRDADYSFNSNKITGSWVIGHAQNTMDPLQAMLQAKVDMEGPLRE